MNDKLTVIVPCYNEEENVKATVDGIFRAAPELPVETSVLMINDGSSDGTLAQMEALKKQYGRCELINQSVNRGLGRSVLNAYKQIPDGTLVTVMPGDNEFIFTSIGYFLEQRDRYDLILGYVQNSVIRPFSRRLASDSFVRIVNLLYGFSYSYLNGMKVYRVECFKGLDIVSSGHAFNAELLAKALLRRPDLRIGEAPFVARGRARGSSKALSPRSVVQAVREVYAGHRSVAEYRKHIIERQHLHLD